MEKNSREPYLQLIASIPEPMLYAMPWWLDTVCGHDGWQVAYLAEHAPLVALPYHVTRISGMSAVITPPLTQWMPLIHPSSPPVFAWNDLLATLPSVSIFDLNVQASPGNESMMKDLAVRYSYILPKGPTHDEVRQRYNAGLRRNLKMALDTFRLEESGDIKTLVDLYKSSWVIQQKSAPSWTEKLLPALYDQLIQHSAGKLTLAYKNGIPVASVLTAWDHHTVYYLAGGRLPSEEAASAHVFLLDHAIGQAMEAGKSFDFEGSMHLGIASFFQTFGASPKPYWQIRKYRGLGKLWALWPK